MADGFLHEAIAFAGNGDRLRLPPFDERAIAAWIRPEANRSMGWYQGGRPDEAFQLAHFVPDGRGPFGSEAGLFLAIGSMAVVVPKADLTGKWHHIVVSWDGAQEVRVAIDGTFPTGYVVTRDSRELARQPQPFKLPRVPKSDAFAPTTVGHIRHPLWTREESSFVGRLDELAVWGRTLDPDEMRRLYSQSRAGQSYAQ